MSTMPEHPKPHHPSFQTKKETTGAFSDLTLRLRELHDALQVARRLALKSTGWKQLHRKDAQGNTMMPQPYTPEAIATFTAALEHHEDDPDLLHHLAIAHHARAWDLELQGSTEAFAAWEEALQYWRRLQTSPAFWQRLRNKGQRLDPNFNPSVLDEARQQLSAHLLEIHLDFIRYYYDQGQVQRAEHHIQLVRRAHLPPAIRKQMDQRLYEAMTGGVSLALTMQQYDAAATAVERFLQLFPQHVPALQQVVEIYLPWVEQTSIQDQWEQLESLQWRANPWMTHLAAHPALDTEPLAKISLAALAFALGNKYRTRARSLKTQREQANRHIDATTVQPERQAYDLAITWLSLTWQHDPNRPYARDSLVDVLLSRADVLADLGLATTDSSQRTQWLADAITDCRQAMGIAPADFGVLYLSAQLLHLQGEAEEARTLTEQAITVAEQAHDTHGVELARALLIRVRLQPLLDQAWSYMQQQRFVEAFRVLEQAVPVAPESFELFYRRAECQWEMGNLKAAKAECRRARKLATHDKEREVLERLEEMIRYSQRWG